MTVESTSAKIAQKLIEESLNNNQKFDLEKVQEVISELKKLPKSKCLSILRSYLKLVKLKIGSYECIVEKTGAIDDSNFSENISNNLPKVGETKPDLKLTSNEDLIAGFRLRLGDDVYEDSIANRLSRLRKSLT